MEIDWDRLAPVYDWQLPLERAALRRLVRLLDVRPDERILDVATGTGAVLRELARLPEPPKRALGIDASAAMLARAWGLPQRWVLERGDARQLPFEDACFDAVTAGYLLHVLDPADRRSVLGEAARLLHPGGRLGVVTVAETGRFSRALLRPIAGVAKRRGPTALRGLIPLDPRPELVDLGFEPIAAEPTRFGYPSLCVVARAPGA